MAENGFGGAETEMQQPKMKLRVIINAIFDQKIHTAVMTEKETIDFMMNKGFQGKRRSRRQMETRLTFVNSAFDVLGRLCRSQRFAKGLRSETPRQS